MNYTIAAYIILIFIYLLIGIFIIKIFISFNKMMLRYFYKKTKKKQKYYNISNHFSYSDYYTVFMIPYIEHPRLYKYMKNSGLFLFWFYKPVIKDIRYATYCIYYINALTRNNATENIAFKDGYKRLLRTVKLLKLKYNKSKKIPKFLFNRMLKDLEYEQR